MSTKGVVEVPEGCDGAHAKRKVTGVNMVKRAGYQTEVHCRTGKHAVGEVPLQVGIVFEEGAEVINIVPIQVWSPGGEGGYGWGLVR